MEDIKELCRESRWKMGHMQQLAGKKMVNEFKRYNFICDIMQGEGKKLLIRELNSTLLYVTAVKEMGYKEIGIFVTDDDDVEISRYASQNNDNGEVTDIVDHFETNSPGITVRVNERTLLEILQNVEYVKDHPYRAFWKYLSDFKPGREKDRKEIRKLPFHSPRILRKILAYQRAADSNPQPPSQAHPH